AAEDAVVDLGRVRKGDFPELAVLAGIDVGVDLARARVGGDHHAGTGEAPALQLEGHGALDVVEQLRRQQLADDFAPLLGGVDAFGAGDGELFDLGGFAYLYYQGLAFGLELGEVIAAGLEEGGHELAGL